jgi:hypothetical protein
MVENGVGVAGDDVSASSCPAGNGALGAPNGGNDNQKDTLEVGRNNAPQPEFVWVVIDRALNHPPGGQGQGSGGRRPSADENNRDDGSPYHASQAGVSIGERPASLNPEAARLGLPDWAMVSFASPLTCSGRLLTQDTTSKSEELREVHFRVLCPAALVGSLIGKVGSGGGRRLPIALFGIF